MVIVLFIIGKPGKGLNHPRGGWLNKLWHIRKTNYVATKNDI